MAKKTINIEVSAETDADTTKIEKALKVYAKAFTAKEHEKLRMIIEYEPGMLAQLKQKLLT